MLDQRLHVFAQYYHPERALIRVDLMICVRDRLF